MYEGECVILPLEGHPILITHPPEIGTALLHTWLDQVYGYCSHYGREEYQAVLLKEHGLDKMRIAIEKKSAAVSAYTYDRLRDALPNAELVDGSNIVSTVKATKSPQEIEYIRHASRITDTGVLAAIAMVGEGKTDNDVAAAANQAIYEAGSEYMCVSPIVTTGRRSGVLHSTHKRVSLSIGDSVCMEFGACVQRYTAPIMRTVSIGRPPEGVKRLANACLTAQLKPLSLP